MINIPTNCPACNSILERVKDQLFCVNPQCEAKTSKLIIHFAKTLGIKGLGQATIDKLELNQLADIFLHEGWKDILGEKTASKLIDQINSLQSVSIAKMIEAFSIKGIGPSVASKIASNVNSPDEITDETMQKAGVGPVARKSFLEWAKDKKWQDLPFTYKVTKEVQKKYTVCITGKLLLKREDMISKLNSLGVKVVDTVSAKVSYLIADETKASSKRRKAEELGIPIVTYKQFIEEIHV